MSSPSTALAKFHARRRKATLAMVIASFQQGFILGSSVIVGALLRPTQRGGFTTGSTSLFPFVREPSTYQFNGLYAVAMALCVTYLVGSELLIPISGKYPRKRRIMIATLVSLMPVAFAIGGAAVSASSTVLLYIAFSVLLGFGTAPLELCSRFEVLQWYSVDGTKSTGIGILGCALGCSAIFFTLYSGWVTRYASLQVTLYTLAGLNAALSGWLVYAIRAGHLDQAPDLIAYKEMDPDFAPQAQLLKPLPPLISVLFTSRSECYKHQVTYLLSVVTATTCFNGYATKVLLSSMFLLIFELTEISAAYLSALSLVLFALGRTLVPWFIQDKVADSIVIYIFAGLLSSLFYGISPLVIGTGTFEPNTFSWRLFGEFGLRVVAFCA